MQQQPLKLIRTETHDNDSRNAWSWASNLVYIRIHIAGTRLRWSPIWLKYFCVLWVLGTCWAELGDQIWNLSFQMPVRPLASTWLQEIHVLSIWINPPKYQICCHLFNVVIFNTQLYLWFNCADSHIRPLSCYFCGPKLSFHIAYPTLHAYRTPSWDDTAKVPKEKFQQAKW